MSKERGQGLWKNAEIYEASAGLPVLKTGRALATKLIADQLGNGPATVLSIGIGTGVMYQTFLKKDIDQGKLNLAAIDILPEMVTKAKQTLGEKAQIEVADVRDPFNLANNSVDVVEAGLVLHHILLREELIDIFRRICQILKPGGIFFLYDIDVEIGGHVENKLEALQKQFGGITIDMATGEFVYLNTGQTQREKILVESNQTDRQVIDQMERLTLQPLIKEMKEFNPAIASAIQDNVTNARKGLEWHRKANNWIKLIEQGFGRDNFKIKLITPKQIKREFSQVKDNPFALIITKG